LIEEKIEGRAVEPTQAGTQKKKEEFPGFMETCCLGTPFPRSALFLETIMWKSSNVGKST
jgi:hypothetical protein